MATALTPQTDVTSEKVKWLSDGEPETAVSASVQKIKLIKNQHKLFFLFHFIKSQISDSFVNHFDGDLAYLLKTLDF